MAMVNNKTQCFKCNREKITYPCKGCSKEFCFTDLSEHKQILNEELHHITNGYNEFKQTINERKQNPQNHSLIEQINQWERNSIGKIIQKAQEYREILIKLSETCINDTEMKFNDLSDQIKEIQKENEFNEINLNYLRNELTEITEELNNPLKISIKEDSQSFINEISIISSKIMDKHGFLYVSDREKNEVRQWKMGEYNNEGIVVAGGNGRGIKLNQFHCPTFIFVDEDQSVCVSDCNNNRVMKWRKDAKEGIIVAGGNYQGRNLNQLCLPTGIIVDDLGQIYVADSGNHRVMRWCEGKKEGEIIVGGNDEGNRSNQLNLPYGLSFDDEGNLYVADERNHRIQKFEIIL
ncbi:unnamed protein product [Adineta steineri]|uniref:NHL repeat containing protein n=2 Tax=Adineta steineri TaxID=433720 RepID=A0A813US31_9BILA|nr:unnamed protein product [Adineta steineri]